MFMFINNFLIFSKIVEFRSSIIYFNQFVNRFTNQFMLLNKNLAINKKNLIATTAVKIKKKIRICCLLLTINTFNNNLKIMFDFKSNEKLFK